MSKPQTTIINTLTDLIEKTQSVRLYRNECAALSERLRQTKESLEKPNREEINDKEILELKKTLDVVSVTIEKCRKPNILSGTKKLVGSKEIAQSLQVINDNLIRFETTLVSGSRAKVQMASRNLTRNHTLKREAYKDELEERRRVLEQTVKNRPETAQKRFENLNQLHIAVMKSYIDKCLRLHSYLQVNGLESTFTDFAQKLYGQTLSAYQVTADLHSVAIPLEATYTHLKADHSSGYERKQAEKLLLIQNSTESGSTAGVPHDPKLWARLAAAPIMHSLKERDRSIKTSQEKSLQITEILQTKRWLVILGDPGSGKTTFVRWIFVKFAQAIFQNQRHVVTNSAADTSSTETTTQVNQSVSKSTKVIIGPSRMPILIRVGEFADAVRKDPSLTLFDYIGQHTWMGSLMFYSHSMAEKEKLKFLSQLKATLQDYVRLGLAILILDGLDEIPASDHRRQVVNLVEAFADLYVQTPSCVSVFDDESLLPGVVPLPEHESPAKYGGNQLIVTSRIVGYHAGPLSGNFAHFTIESMGLLDIDHFVDRWFRAVHTQLIKALKLKIDAVKVSESWRAQANVLKAEIHNSSNTGARELASSPFLLSIICSLAFRMYGKPLPAQRISLYQEAVESIMNIWTKKRLSIKVEELRWILSSLAVHIHQNSASGLVEEYDLSCLCTNALKSYKRKKVTSDSELEDETKEFVRMIRDDVGILAARGEFVYGFLHLTFQEYFTCLSLVDIPHILTSETTTAESKSHVKVAANLIQYHIRDPRFRIPLILALGYVSHAASSSFSSSSTAARAGPKWTLEDYNALCLEIVSSKSSTSQHLPLGPLLFITSIGDLVVLPSKMVVFSAFDQVTIASGVHKWFAAYPHLQAAIVQGLSKLPASIATEWSVQFLCYSSQHSTESIIAFCSLVISTIKDARLQKNKIQDGLPWLTTNVVQTLWKHLARDNFGTEFVIDDCLTQIAAFLPDCLPNSPQLLRTYLVEKQISIKDIHPSVIALIIAIYGGLCREERMIDGETQSCIYFSSSRIHRDSCITPLLKKFLDSKASNALKLTKLLHQVQQIIDKSTKDDESLTVIDGFISLLCLTGVDNIWLYQPYATTAAFKLALHRLQRTAVYLSDLYFVPSSEEKSFASNVDHIVSEFLGSDEESGDELRDSTKIPLPPADSVFQFLRTVSVAAARLSSSNRSFLFADLLTGRTVQTTLPNYFKDYQSIQQHFKSSVSSTDSMSLDYMRLIGIGATDDRATDEDYSLAVMTDTTGFYAINMSENNALLSLFLIPNHLQRVFLRLVARQKLLLSSTPRITSSLDVPLSMANLLVQIMLNLNYSDAYQYRSVFIICVLLPVIKQWKLGNFASAIISNISSPYLKRHFYTVKYSSIPLTMKIHENEEFGSSFLGGTGISEDEELKLILSAIDEERANIFEAKMLVKKEAAKQLEMNIQLYSAAVSLAYLAWCAITSKDYTLMNESIQAVLAITNSVLRADALRVVMSHPFMQLLMATSVVKEMTTMNLHKVLADTIKQFPSETSLLEYTVVVLQCLPLLGVNETTIDFLSVILNELNTKNKKTDMLADLDSVCEALLPFTDWSSTVLFSVSIYLQQRQPMVANRNKQIMGFGSSVFRQNFDASSNTDQLNIWFRNLEWDSDGCIPTLLSSMYLIELCYDSQSLFEWFPQIEHHPSSILFPSVQLRPSISKNKDFFTKAGVFSQSNVLILDNLVRTHKNTMEILNAVAQALHGFTLIETVSRTVVEGWLKYRSTKNEALRFVSFHAALMLGGSNMWNVPVAEILCDLLHSDHDRFRQRSEVLLTQGTIRTSTDIGLEVLLVFVKSCVSYASTSVYASLILSWMFARFKFDQVSHLHALLQIEKQRTRLLAKRKLYSLETLEATKQYKDYVMRGMDIKQSVLFCLCRLSFKVLSHFLEYIQSYLDTIPNDPEADEDDEVEHECYSQFLVKVLGKCGGQLIQRASGSQLVLLVDFFGHTLEQNTSVDVQLACAYALAYSKPPMSFSYLLQHIQAASFGLKSRKSDNVISMCIRSYCRAVSSQSADISETTLSEQLMAIKQLLNYSSTVISTAAAAGLARCYVGLKEDLAALLMCLNYDIIRCYNALVTSTQDNYVTTGSVNCVKGTVELIHKYPSLMTIFVQQLYDSIKHFSKDIECGSERYAVTDFGVRKFVDIAAHLVKLMPAAFLTEVELTKLSKALRKALFFTSKQHDFPRRASALAVCSLFGQLTIEMSEMFVQALSDAPYCQAMASECIARIETSNDRSAIEPLFRHLKSNSLNTRWTAAKLLTRLARGNIVSVSEVQEKLTEALLDPVSKNELWVMTENTKAEIVTDGSYSGIGQLDQVLYGLLAELSFVHGTKEASIFSSHSNSTTIKNAFSSRFQDGVKAQYIACCKISTMRTTKFTAMCGSSTGKQAVDLYIGEPYKLFHPLTYQTVFYKNRAIEIPQDVQAAVVKLHLLSTENDVSFPKLSFYAFRTASEKNADSDAETEANTNTTADT